MTQAPASFRVLGTRIHAVQIPEVVRLLTDWAVAGAPPRTVVAANAHVVNEARRDPAFSRTLEGADLAVADGTPLRWIGRLHGFPMPRRVYGPELMLATLEHTAPLGLRHFFYGALPGVADDLAKKMSARFPGLQIAGTWSPPMAPLSPVEDPAAVAAIRAARPHFLWVSLGCPKQEKWIASRRDLLQVPVTAGVGAAFDFLTGRARQAPPWLREHGLEWAFRLATEPGRLWRRYLIQGSEFAACFAFELATGRWRRRMP